MSVKLPVEFRKMLPELVMVPEILVVVLLLPMKLPELVSDVSVAVFILWIMPVPTVARIPPVTTMELVNCTSDPSSA